jgi:hypothetical protein
LGATAIALDLLIPGECRDSDHRILAGLAWHRRKARGRCNADSELLVLDGWRLDLDLWSCLLVTASDVKKQ